METITPYKHLKDDVYYSELYDRMTIEYCRRWEGLKDGESLEEKHKDSPAKGLVVTLGLYFKKGERYREKSETINRWMERDRAKDQRVADSQIPRGVRCLGCSSPVNCISRDLHTNLHDKEEILFMFECPRCSKRRSYWENGQEWVPRKNPCPKCRAGLESKMTREGNIIKTEYACPGCGHQETDTWDLDKNKEEAIDPTFEADRKEYCLSDEEGVKYIEGAEKLKHVTEMMKDHEENKELYDSVAKIKKIPIAEVEKLLIPALEKIGYIRLAFDKPEFTKGVVVGFTVQDTKTDCSEYDSRMKLKKLINETLSDTNWRLMSDGVAYQLGFLSGRIRGVQSEDELKKLVNSNKHGLDIK